MAAEAGTGSARRVARGPVGPTATELGLDDDILTSVLVDRALGLQTHKMGRDFAPIAVDAAAVRPALCVSERATHRRHPGDACMCACMARAA